MSRVIHREVKLDLAQMMLFGDLQNGGIAKLNLVEEDGKKSISITAEALPEESEESLEEDSEVNAE